MHARAKTITLVKIIENCLHIWTAIAYKNRATKNKNFLEIKSYNMEHSPVCFHLSIIS